MPGLDSMALRIDEEMREKIRTSGSSRSFQGGGGEKNLKGDKTSSIAPEVSMLWIILALYCEPVFNIRTRLGKAVLNPRTLNRQKWILRN